MLCVFACYEVLHTKSLQPYPIASVIPAGLLVEDTDPIFNAIRPLFACITLNTVRSDFNVVSYLGDAWHRVLGC